jgi:hypothetical protein
MMMEKTMSCNDHLIIAGPWSGTATSSTRSCTRSTPW